MPRTWAAASAPVNVATGSRSRRCAATANTPEPAVHSATIADNTASGPNSTNTDTPSPHAAPTASANRTGEHTCPTQYSGSHTSTPDTNPPDTSDTKPTTGTDNPTPDNTPRKPPNTGSINTE